MSLLSVEAFGQLFRDANLEGMILVHISRVKTPKTRAATRAPLPA